MSLFFGRLLFVFIFFKHKQEGKTNRISKGLYVRKTLRQADNFLGCVGKIVLFTITAARLQVVAEKLTCTARAIISLSIFLQVGWERGQVHHECQYSPPFADRQNNIVYILHSIQMKQQQNRKIRLFVCNWVRLWRIMHSLLHLY